MLEYTSPNYSTDRVTNRYLHIDLATNQVMITETDNKTKHNYTIRSYVLPITEYEKYSSTIEQARAIMHNWPNKVEIKE
jgi:hypothetical protein